MEQANLTSETETEEEVETNSNTDFEDSVIKESENENEISEAEENNEKNADYESIARNDLEILKEEFSELSDAKSILELENPLRYAALRDLGLSPSEAYRATASRRPRQDNRFHLESSVPRAATMPLGTMSEAELRAAREIFSDISDSEIRNLYKRVTQ